MIAKALGSTIAAVAFVAGSLAATSATAGALAVLPPKPDMGIEQVAKPADLPNKSDDSAGLSKFDHAESSKSDLAGSGKEDDGWVMKDDKPGGAAAGLSEPAAKPGSAAGESNTGK